MPLTGTVVLLVSRLTWFQAISDNVGLVALHSSPFLDYDDHVLDQAALNAFTAQQNGRRLAKEWKEGDGSGATALPLCTLVFEVVDKSDSTWKLVNLVLQHPELADPSLYAFSTIMSNSAHHLQDHVSFS